MSDFLRRVTFLPRVDSMVNCSCTNRPIIPRLENLDHRLTREEFMPFPGHRTELNYSLVPVTNLAKYGTLTIYPWLREFLYISHVAIY